MHSAYSLDTDVFESRVLFDDHIEVLCQAGSVLEDI